MPATTDNVTARLLEEGARSYLKAVTALAAFEHEVQKRCQNVLEEHLDDLSAAIGMQRALASSEIKPVVYEPDSGHEWRSVGVEIVRKGLPIGIRYWGFYCLLYWQHDLTSFKSTICEWLGPKNFAASLGRKFQKASSEVWQDGREVGVSTELKDKDASVFEKNLESLLRQWIKLWKQVGGMKGAFKKNTTG